MATSCSVTAIWAEVFRACSFWPLSLILPPLRPSFPSSLTGHLVGTFPQQFLFSHAACGHSWFSPLHRVADPSLICSSTLPFQCSMGSLDLLSPLPKMVPWPPPSSQNCSGPHRYVMLIMMLPALSPLFPSSARTNTTLASTHHLLNSYLDFLLLHLLPWNVTPTQL